MLYEGIHNLWKLFLVSTIIFVEIIVPYRALSTESVLTERVSHDVIVDDPTSKHLIDIDKEVLLECIKLLRFNIHFHEEANRRWPWRDWLYPIEKEAATALTLAGTTTDLTQRANGYNNPNLISQSAQRNGLSCSIAGRSIGGTASTLELIQNGIVVVKAKHQGYSPKDSVAFVKNSLNKIDNLLAQRVNIAASIADAQDKHLRALQARLLKHLRNVALYEFTQWSIDSREREWSESTFFAIDAVQNFVGLASSIVARNGLTNSTHLGSAAIISLTSNVLEAVNPIVRTVTAHCMAKHQKRHLTKIFAPKKLRTTEEVLDEFGGLNEIILQNVSAKSPNASLNEVAFLIQNSQSFDGPLQNEVKRIERLRRVGDQQAITGPVIGTAKAAGSICSIVGSYGYSSQPIQSNRIKLAGNISTLCGQSLSLIATPTALIKHMAYKRRLAKNGQLPEQILRVRLEKLDALEAKIKSSAFF